jgi:hypothetical protein
MNLSVVAGKGRKFAMKRKYGQNVGCRGQGLTEYLMILMLVSVVALGVVSSLGREIKSKLQVVRSHINQEISPDSSGN